MPNETDAITKEYMRDNRVFADVCNYFLKKNIVKPEELREYDTTELYIPALFGPPFFEETEDSTQKYRDVMKECAVAMADNRVAYVLFGIENQTKIDYSMVLRACIYDAMRYSKQLREIAREHERKKDLTGDAFLSHFAKDDRVKPVITIVVYYGTEPWDAAMELHGLLTAGCEELYPLVGNYRLNVLEASALTDAELEGFQSSLREVLTFIKYADDSKKLTEAVNSNENFRHMDTLAARVVKSVTGTRIDINENKEEMDMCKAIQDMMTEATETGIQIGEQRGIQIGEQRGIQIGVRQGEQKARADMVISMYDSGIGLATIAEITKMRMEEINAILAARGN